MTTLTDDELILLDVMFDGFWMRPPLLRRAIFRERWNTAEHSLSDEELRETLLRWTRSGLLEFGVEGYVRITAQGGSLWEAERTPVWDRFACGHSRPLPSGDRVWMILARQRQIAEHYYWWHVTVGLRARVPARRMHRVEVRRCTWLRWKRFPTWQLFALPVQDRPIDEVLRANWQELESHRSWWNTVRDLQKFLD